MRIILHILFKLILRVQYLYDTAHTDNFLLVQIAINPTPQMSEENTERGGTSWWGVHYGQTVTH
jgi:hypothetical protein